MTRLIADLLLLARHDAGDVVVPLQPVYLRDLIETALAALAQVPQLTGIVGRF
jgi:signal transduction histidine kinase